MHPFEYLKSYYHLLLFQISDENNHPPDEGAVIAADIMSVVRKQVRNSTQPLPSIFNDMLADTRSMEWVDAIQDVVFKLPTFYTAKSGLYRYVSVFNTCVIEPI